MLFLTMQSPWKPHMCECMYISTCAYIKNTNVSLKDVIKINLLQNFTQELQKERYHSVTLANLV